MTTAAMERSAVISDDELYRYSLTRRWGPNKLFVTFVMLNPSRADGTVDDPTIRRCVGFARALGYDALEVVNLFALRSPNPEDLRACFDSGMDPVGPLNDKMIDFACGRAARCIVAWGSHAFAKDRVRDVLALKGLGAIVECLGVTKDGSPRHPLYVRADQPLVRFAPFGL